MAARGELASRDPAVAAVETRAVGKRFRRAGVDVLALDAVDMHVAQGEIFGLIGPNGAGKSTLVSVIATLMRPTTGSARVMGHDVVREARAARRQLSFNASAGERGFYWRLTSRQNLEFFAALQGLDRQAARRSVEAALARVGLAEARQQRFGEFSSGMKRRLNVARALLVDRPIYLFDEPTSGVDPHSASVIRGILGELRGAGKTIVLVTHDMDEASLVCDRVGMLYAGRMIRQDSPEALRRHVPSGEIEVELRDPAAAGEVLARLRRLPVVEEARRLREGWLRVRTAAPDDDVRGLMLWAASDGLPVAGVSVVRAQLSDAFVRLVEEATGQAPPSEPGGAQAGGSPRSGWMAHP